MAAATKFPRDRAHAKGIKDATDKQRHGVEAGIRSCLESNAGKTVQRAGEGVPMRWKIA